MLFQIFLLFLLVALFFLWSLKRKFRIQVKCLRLPMIANSFIFAIASGCFLWQLRNDSMEVYTDFVGGFLAMASMGKTFEYHAFYLGIIVFFISFGVLGKIYSNFKTNDDINIVKDLSLYALIVPAIMVGQIFIFSCFTTVFYVSALSVLVGLLMVLLKFFYPKFDRHQLLVFMVGIFFGVASYLSIKLFFNRIAYPSYFSLFFIIIFGLFFYLARHKKWCNKFLVISQFGLPFAFGNLLFPIQVLKNGDIFNPGFNSRVDLIVIVLILIGFYTLVKAFRTDSDDFQKLIPSLPLAAFICMFCASAEQWGSLMFGDDYHNGEIILPWFLFQKFGCNIYIDYIPSRGMVNYIPGFLLWFFKGHDFSYIQHFIKWADFPLYFLGIVILRRRCCLLVAFLSCAGLTCLTPAIGSGLMYGMLAWAFLSDVKWEKKPTIALVIFFITGLIGTMYSLTDAVPVYVSMIPMALYITYLAWKIERKMLYVFIVGVSLTLILIICIPLVREILLETMNILFLQSDSYTVAHCVPLMEHNIKQKTIYYVIVNYMFVLLLIVFSLRLFVGKKIDEHEQYKDYMNYFAIASLVILGVILIQRAGGRASCSLFDRAWTVSYMFLIIGLPLWYMSWVGNKIKIVHILIFSILLGILGSYINNFNSLPDKINGILYEPENTINPSENGLINLGENTLLKEEHYQHHVQVKNVIKSIIPNISQKGVFWDLTNNSTIYAYCGEGLIPPMSYPSYFYVASLKLSKKMQEQIQKNKPILVLIKGKNVEFYEGNLALRSYYLYKYLMDNYIVFTDIYDKTWMIRKGYEKLLDNSKFVKLDKLGDQDVLSEALDYKTLDGYPKSWGNSVNILKNKLCNPIDLSPTYINKTTIGLVGDENLTGDFLYLKFNRQINSRWITIAWEDNFNNKGKNFIAFWGGTNEYLVPLFASTNWYLGYNKNNLIIQHKDNLSEPLVLTEVKLYNRIISNKN